MLRILKSELAKFLSQIIDTEETLLSKMMELKPDHADIALKTFGITKDPKQFSQNLLDKFSNTKHPFKSKIKNIETKGGFINFNFESKYLFEILLNNSGKENFENLKLENANKKIIIDYSSPNVAKPLSIGHLRSTILGASIYNLAKTLGYKVVGLNYLGDWGVQFGKLIYGYLNWKDEYDFTNAFESLYSIYVRFHEEEKTNKNLENKGALYFKKLESGDKEALDLWKYFVKITLEEHNRTYELLGIKFDLIQGESFFNSKIKQTFNLLESKNIVQKSRGATVINVGEDLPPLIIKKSDGASLYSTRDIASNIYRKNSLNGDIFLYVVGADQTLYFKQLFKAFNRAGFKWAKDCHHISFGLYRFKQAKMSTRRGNVVFMNDVLEKAISMSKEKLQNRSLDNIDEIAKSVGVGAIIFNDLMNDRVKNVDFNWDQILDFNGDSGPYVQYTLVRCRSILSKYTGNLSVLEFNSDDIERRILLQLLSFDEVLINSFNSFKPHILAQYLLKMCKLINKFYGAKKVLCEDKSVREGRVALIFCAEKILSKGLEILQIPIPSKM